VSRDLIVIRRKKFHQAVQSLKTATGASSAIQVIAALLEVF